MVISLCGGTAEAGGHKIKTQKYRVVQGYILQSTGQTVATQLQVTAPQTPSTNSNPAPPPEAAAPTAQAPAQAAPTAQAPAQAAPTAQAPAQAAPTAAQAPTTQTFQVQLVAAPTQTYQVQLVAAPTTQVTLQAAPVQVLQAAPVQFVSAPTVQVMQASVVQAAPTLSGATPATFLLPKHAFGLFGH
jgi:hypothetical protein